MTSTTVRKKSAQCVVLPNESASHAVSALAPGCRIVGITKGQFSMIDLIKAILDRIGPADLTLSTWTAGIRDVDNVGFLVEVGALRSLRLLTDRSFPTRNPAYCQSVLDVFGRDAIRMTNIHAKFALLRNDDWSVVIRSSMNLNRNARWEQFDLDDDANLFDWFNLLVEDIWRTVPAGLSVPGSVVEAGFRKQGSNRNEAPASAIGGMIASMRGHGPGGGGRQP